MSVGRRHVARSVAVLAALGLALTACTGEDEETTAPATAPAPAAADPQISATGAASSAEPRSDSATTPGAATAAPTAEQTGPGTLPPWQPGGERSIGEPAGEPLLSTALRVGAHDGFDRLVIELRGDGLPGWQVEYVADATADGSGDRLEVDGDAILSVYVSGTRYPEEDEEGWYDGPKVLDGEDAIGQVRYVGTFEGLTQLFIGVDDDPADFRVFALADPARLVIDVRDG